MWKFRKAAGQKIQIALNPILCKSSLFELLHIDSTQNLSDSLLLFLFFKKNNLGLCQALLQRTLFFWLEARSFMSYIDQHFNGSFESGQIIPCLGRHDIGR